MYKTIIAAIILIFSISVMAQQNKNIKVPDNVSKAFQKAHPDATDVTWDKEGNNYEANYKEDKNFSVVIDKEGSILETESGINVTDLPSGVIKYINENYKGYTFYGAAKIIDNKGNVKYETEIKNGNVSKDVMFDKDGNPLKKEGKMRNEDKD